MKIYHGSDITVKEPLIDNFIQFKASETVRKEDVVQ